MKQKTEQKSEIEQYKMAALFQQKSAEVYALQIQAYNTAKARLDDYMNSQFNSEQKPPAIVIDLDETVVNNMPFVAQGFENGFDYTEWGKDWTDWVDAASADLIPGSKNFLLYADRQGVQIFYVSNRLTEELEATMKNLDKHNLPQVSKGNVLLWGGNGTKKERRDMIKQNFEVILLIGNSLYDLSSVFINESTDEQMKVVDRHADKFGDKFILLPNSSYGDYWVNASLTPWK